jgi:uncharacterized protein HemY
MKYCLCGLSLLVFLVQSILAVAVSSGLSLLHWIVKGLCDLLEKISRFFRKLKNLITMTITSKGGTSWLVFRVWRFSVLFGYTGKKNGDA